MNKSGKKVAPAAKKRGADAQVPASRDHQMPTQKDVKLEQGLEESMAGSDPPSILSRRRMKGYVQKTVRAQQKPSPASRSR